MAKVILILATTDKKGKVIHTHVEFKLKKKDYDTLLKQLEGNNMVVEAIVHTLERGK